VVGWGTVLRLLRPRLRLRLWLETPVVLRPGPLCAAPGYASGYQAGAADVAACVERFRSYDPVSRTYMGRDRRRHPCPL